MSRVWYAAHLTPLAAANPRACLLVDRTGGRAAADGRSTTVAYTQTQSLVPPVLTSTPMRRVLRPGARLMRPLPFDATVTPTNLLTRINAGEVSAAPPKTVPPGVPTVDQAAGAGHPAGVPGWILDLLAQVSVAALGRAALGRW